MRISEIDGCQPRAQRRAVLFGLGAVVLAAAAPRPARASAESQAAALVQQLAGELTGLVNSGGGAGQVTAGFERILARYGDIPAVAAAALGPPWRAASDAQKRSYVAAFQSYLARKYGRQFNEYRNATVSVSGARDAGKAGVLVNTVVRIPGRDPIAVDWQVSARSGQPRVVNLVIEGVSMLANERAEIGAMLEAQGGSIDRLTAQLANRS